MNSHVLILAPWNDPHADAVRWALNKNAVKSVVIPSFAADKKGCFSIRSDQQGTTLESAHFSSGDTGFRSAWYRRPAQPQPEPSLDADREFITRQWRFFQKNVFDLGPMVGNTLWVNNPTSGMVAESKLVQLEAARAAGLAFPELVVTNKADDARKMIERYGRVVYKTFFPQSWQSEASGNIYSLGIALLDADSELPEEPIAVCPGIFQRYIDKAYDLRITVIGSKFFPVRIRKQNGEAHLDWRQTVLEEETFADVVELPQTLTDQLRDLMRRLDIVFGCVDIVVDREGQAYFLEVNQAGQFMFMEEKTGSAPLLRAITAMLSTGRCDYSLDDCVPLSFLEYRGSDDYRKVMDSFKETPLFVSMEP